MKIPELRAAVDSLLEKNPGKPVVVFAAIWPFLRSLDIPREEIPSAILKLLLDAAGRRSLLMPTFTGGYKDGVCDLDAEPSTTGVLSENFRRLPGCRRSLSAFFSFATLGPDADEVAELRPECAWGDGSTYHWMETRDASFLMLGTHPTHCSYLHRVEWLARDVLPYRYDKKFSGTILRDKKRHALTETLYVRRLEPETINDFTTITGALTNGGMKILRVDGISIARMPATAMRDAFLPRLREDPLLVVQNRRDFEIKEKAHGR